MKNIYIVISIFFTLLFFTTSVNAQDPLSLYYLENVPQTVSINPAMVPRANAFFGVPGINSIYTSVNTDLLGSSIIQEYNGGHVTLTQKGFDYAPFLDHIGDAANISSYQTIAPIVMGFSGKKGYFTFSWTEKLNESMAIPQDFFKILDKGFPNDSKFDFSPMAMNAQYYRELSFGYSYKFMSKLRVGIHAKLLQGLFAIKTDIDKFDINTNVDEWTLDLKGDIYMSAPLDVTVDENGIPTVEMPDTDMEMLIDKGITNFSNPGIAVDFGAVYEHNEAWTFSASVNDLGFINWNGDLNSFNADGKFKFDGLNIDASNMDSIDNVVDDVLDSLKQAVKLTHGSEGFSTGLGPKLYIGALYNVNYYFSVGALSRTVFAKNDFRQEFNVSANLNLYHVLTTSFNYTLAVNGANTFGLGLALRGGPLQVYVAMDYIPHSAYKNVSIESTDSNGEPTSIPYVPTRLDNFNMMFGVNLLFGANGYRDEPMVDSYNEF
jgi:hypothetical protein